MTSPRPPAKLEASTTPPPAWEAQCSTTAALFGSPPWLSLIDATLGARSSYLQFGAAPGAALTVFKRGPFRIGHVGFPVGGDISGRPLGPDVVSGLRDLELPDPPHIVYLAVSPFRREAAYDLPDEAAPDTAIPNLPDWSPARVSESARRNVRKSRRLGVEIRDPGPDDGAVMFALYRETIRRWSGTARYTADYFNGLAALASDNDQIRCMIASHEGTAASFVVVAEHSGHGYYLHGGSDMSQQRTRSGDLLFLTAIEWAQQRGLATFQMLRSPASQPSLTRYKEKWGAVTRAHHTYEIVRAPVASRLFSLSKRAVTAARALPGRFR